MGACPNGRRVAQSFPADGIQKVEIVGGAGRLRIAGKGDAIHVDASICGPSRDATDMTAFAGRRDGNAFSISGQYPLTLDGSRTTMDMTIDVPRGTVVEATSRAGGVSITGVAGASVEALAGDVEAAGIAGNVTIARDGAGDLTITNIDGTAAVQQDSGGRLSIRNVKGNVVIQQSSAYVTTISNVKGDVVIWSDGTGDINVRNVGGELFIQSDSAGKIRYHHVAGAVVLPHDIRALKAP